MFSTALRGLAAALGLAAAACFAGQAAAQDAAACPPTAQRPSTAQQQAAERQARDRGFLWRIEQGGRTSWLYGTIHVARYEWTVPGPQLAAALRQARVLALEIDLGDPQALADALLASPALTGGGALPPAVRERLARRLAAECLPTALADLLPPTLQAATLGALAGRREGLDPAWAIDMALSTRAHAAKKRVIALESLADQLAALQGRDSADSLRFVERTLDDLDSGRALPQVRRIAEVWARADHGELERWPAWCDCLDSPADRALMHRLLDARNGAMAERIDALHREGGAVLAAVGALHMTGPQGLPALLAARGYRVERVPFAR
ncbi:MAG TPA: TraB/GumN family protein [Methylibium sp.]|nr:TraB/GumN family protein [Methylibium sp.]